MGLWGTLHVLLLTLALLLLGRPALAQEQLSPPWWVTYKMFKAALVPDRCLNVSDLAKTAEDPTAAFAFNITACPEASADKLAGLATFLTVRLNFGGTLFLSRVYDSAGNRVHPLLPDSGRHALELAAAALHGNQMFVKTAVSSPMPCFDFYWVVFKPEIVQIWVDNLADLWGNINLLAAELYARVMRLEQYGIRTTTEPIPPSKGQQAGPSSDGDRQQQLAQQQQQQLERQSFQQLILLAQPQTGRRQLEAAASNAAMQEQEQRQAGAGEAARGSWQQAGRCWALSVARRVGGESAVTKLLPWVL